MKKTSFKVFQSIVFLIVFVHGGLFLVDRLRFQADDAELYGMGSTEIFLDLIGPEHLGECAESKELEFYYTGESVKFRCSDLLESIIFWPYSITITTTDSDALKRIEEKFLKPYRELEGD